MAKVYKNQNLKIVQYIIEQETNNPEDCQLKGRDELYCLTTWFYAAKYNSRLTPEGMWYMKRWFKTIRIKFTHDNANLANAGHIFWLSQNIKTPYYISYKGKYLELFNEEDAIELIMLDGDLDQYARIYRETK